MLKATCTCILLLAGTATAAAQSSCRSGVPDTTEASVRWVVPYSASHVRDGVFEGLRASGFRARGGWSRSGVFVTNPSFQWLPRGAFAMWRDREHPGVTVRVEVKPSGNWSEITVTARTLCRTSSLPPPGWNPALTAEKFVARETANVIDGNVGFALHRFPFQPGPDCAPLRDGDAKVLICMALVANSPDDPAAVRNLALALIRFHKVPDALPVIEHLFWLAGDQLEEYLTVADALLEAEAYAPAAEYARRGISLWPKNPLLHLQLGIASRFDRRFRDALTHLERAVALDSGSAVARYEYAAILHRTGRRVEAQRVCRAATELFIGDGTTTMTSAPSLAYVAHCATLLGDHHSAVEYFTWAYQVEPAFLWRRRELVSGVLPSFQALGREPPLPPRDDS